MQPKEITSVEIKSIIPESYGSSVSIKKLSELDKTTAKKAIEKINHSNDWSRNDFFVFTKYLSENSILFAVKEEEIIGYVTFREYIEGKKHENPHYYIPYIAVELEKQGQKGGFAASELMKGAITKARGAKAAKLVLEYRGKSEKSKHFYEKIGRIENLKIKDKVKGNYFDGDQKNKFTYYL